MSDDEPCMRIPCKRTGASPMFECPNCDDYPALSAAEIEERDFGHLSAEVASGRNERAGRIAFQRTKAGQIRTVGSTELPGWICTCGHGCQSASGCLNGHWLMFNDHREVVGCHCGFVASPDDEGWGDSVVDHLVTDGARRWPDGE